MMVVMIVFVLGEILNSVLKLRFVFFIFLILNVKFLIIIKIVINKLRFGKILLVIFCVFFFEMVIICYMFS